jgi:putative ABC transport system permease protein
MFLRDVRYAFRTFSHRPSFTAIVVTTLALGIGSNVAIFSVANAVLLRPLPFEDPDRLVLIWNKMTTANRPNAPVSGPDLLDYRNQTILCARSGRARSECAASPAKSSFPGNSTK